jgi:hypothetical protein
MSITRELQLINSTPTKMLLVLEPRSSEFWIKSGSTVKLRVTGATSGQPLDVEYLVGGLVVYANDGGKVEVYQDGLRLAQDNRSRRMARNLTR